MRSRSFARASFGLSGLGMNFFCCVDFFRFRMASPPCVAINRWIMPYARLQA